MACELFSGLAGQVLEDLNYPSGVTSGSVANWFEANLPQLNVLIDECHVLSGSGNCPEPPLNFDESGVLYSMYMVRYFKRAANQNLQAGSFANGGNGAANWNFLKEGDSEIRRNSPSDLAKIFMTLSKQSQEELDKLTDLYKRNRAIPVQVVGNNAEGLAPIPYRWIGRQNIW